MANYILSACTTADLSNQKFHDRNISYLCYHYVLGDKEYVDDLGSTISMHEFYQKMEEGIDAKTSQVSVGQYYDYFKKYLDNGSDIFHVVFSSGLSGSYNSAIQAVEMLKEEYPERKIYVVDSLAASSGYGLLMDKLADLRDEGKTIEELNEFVLNNRLRVNHWVYSTTLKYYVKGGRVSKTAGFVGNIIGICPIIYVNKEGKLIPVEKTLGTKKAETNLLNKMINLADSGLDYADKCFISHSDVLSQATSLAKRIEETFPHLKGKVEIYDIGTTIGSHTGPGTIALFFWGKKREK